MRDLVKKYMGEAEAAKRPNGTTGIPESEVGLQMLIVKMFDVLLRFIFITLFFI